MNQTPYPFVPPMVQNNDQCAQSLRNIEALLKDINDKLNIAIKQKQTTYIHNDDNLYML